jgi:hypothetical protein
MLELDAVDLILLLELDVVDLILMLELDAVDLILLLELDAVDLILLHEDCDDTVDDTDVTDETWQPDENMKDSFPESRERSNKSNKLCKQAYIKLINSSLATE